MHTRREQVCFGSFVVEEGGSREVGAPAPKSQQKVGVMLKEKGKEKEGEKKEELELVVMVLEEEEKVVVVVKEKGGIINGSGDKREGGYGGVGEGEKH
ncbi:hypothetical protein E2C01_045500 [Portunus trituberculatus]|uniref:Uncharacterized protein n=1 Tax=Portunus trituberculatus TaxID=210409 RepID=A0A5B7G3C0_PORTR|nr:hypothetical protein [Portunus trituberculatus]